MLVSQTHEGVGGQVPVCYAGRFDLVDDDDLLVAEHRSGQSHTQTGACRFGNLNQQRPRRRGNRVWESENRVRVVYCEFTTPNTDISKH